MLFGTGRADITPPTGVELCGYGPYLERRATAIHQRLHCTALALSDGSATYVLVSNDLIWLDRSLVDATHRLVQAVHGLDPGRVIMTCTHTHSGPATMKTIAWGEWDHGYTRSLPALFSEAIGQAIQNLQSGRIGFGRVDIPDLSVNRVDEDGPVDREAMLIRVDDAKGRMRAAAVLFGAHPVTLGGSALVCGDYPGDGIAKMERELGGAAKIMFLQGSCGNLNCRGFGKGLEMMESNGALLSERVLPALETIQTTRDVTLSGDTVEMPLPMQVPRREPVAEELQDYQRQLAEFTGEPGSKEGRQLRFEIAWRRERLALLDGPHPGRIEIRIGYLRINRAVLVAHPLELFLEYGNRIKEHSPYPNTFLIGYANEALGYLARPVDFEQKGFGWYAAVYAPRLCRHLQFDREAGDVFCNHIIALLHRIKQKEEQN